MAMQQIAGAGPVMPMPPSSNDWGVNGAVIDATGEKIAFCGRVFYSGRSGTKAISRVQFLFGTVTKAGGSALTVSLQDVAAATLPAQPDGTPDQTVAIANGDASFASNTWYRTGAFSADRTVSYGESVAIVIEFDGSGRLGADAVNINGLETTSTGVNIPGASTFVLYTASWAAQTRTANVILEFSDGTFGALQQSFPCSVVTKSSAFSSASSPDEQALRFRLPFPAQIDGFVLWWFDSNSATYDVVLYDSDGTTALATTTVDGAQIQIDEKGPYSYAFPSAVNLSANTTYRVSIKPGASSVRLGYFDVNANGLLAACSCGVEWYYSSRTDAGAWTDVTTRRPAISLSISGFDDGVSSGGFTPLASFPYTGIGPS